MSTIKDKLLVKAKVKQEEFAEAPLSKCIEIGLLDMKESIKKGVRIAMGTWVAKEATGDCYACFAGCVMLETFNVEPHLTLEFGLEFCLKQDIKFLDGSQARFHALDNIRHGSIGCALMEMYNYEEISEYRLWNRAVPKFDKKNPEPFFVAMEEISMLLKEKGF